MNQNDVVNKLAVESVKPSLPDWLVSEEHSTTNLWELGVDIDSKTTAELKQSLKLEWWDKTCDRDVVDHILTEKLTAFYGEELVYSLGCQQSFESLLKSCGRIISITLGARGSDIEICGEQLSFKTEAIGDCCSTSWFEAYGHSNFNDIIGKEVSSLKILRNVKYKQSGRDQCDINTQYTLTFTDQSIFKFLFRNSSNGYYSGHMNVVSCRKTGSEEKFIQNADARVVIVVGLPRSGKTTFMRKSHLHSQFDDCLFEPMFFVQLKEKLELGETVALNDPRLCELDKFQSLYDRIMLNMVSPSQIFIIYFDNDPQQCIRNLNNKGSRSFWNRRKRVTKEYITELSAKYNETLKFIATLTDCVQQKLDVVFAEEWSSYEERKLKELGFL